MILTFIINNTWIFSMISVLATAFIMLKFHTYKWIRDNIYVFVVYNAILVIISSAKWIILE